MNRTTTQDFIEKAKLKHGNLYSYNNCAYESSRLKVTVTCNKHGDFELLPTSHLRGTGCRKCFYENTPIITSNYKLNKKFEGIKQPEDYKLIPLSKGEFALVDNEDFDRLKDINWCYANGYAKNNKLGLMHRIILNTPNDSFTDHVNQNRLDNRKSNLRLCNQSQNMANVKPIKNKSSKYKGVYWNKKENKWYVQIKNKKFGNIFIGVFENEEEAGRAYDLKAIEIHGEFAVLNFK